MKLLSHHRLRLSQLQQRAEQHKRRHSSNKLLKKVAKLEKKLSKYYVGIADAESDRESVASRSRSRSRARRGRGHCKRSPSGSSTSSSSSSDSCSHSSSSASSSSSRSPSPRGRRCPSRSRSLAGHHGKAHHHHRHRRAHQSHSPQRGAHSWLRHYRGRHQHAPHLDREPLGPLDSTPASRQAQPEAEPSPDGHQMELVDQVELGPPLDEGLAGIWSKIAREGMPVEEKEALLRKYPVSEALKGPRLNEELLALLPKAVLQRDVAQMQSQDQIGSSLTALGRAMDELNDKPGLQNDEKLVDVLESLNAAASLILEMHREITRTRQELVLSSLNKRVRSVAESCTAADGLLFGADLGEKINSAKSRGKGGKRSGKSDDEGDKPKRKGHNRKSMVVEISDLTGRVPSRDRRHHRHHHAGPKN